MAHPKQLLRLFEINRVLIKHGLDEVLLATNLFRPLRFLRYVLPWNWIKREQPAHAVRIRRALEDLGPIFVKFGQLLSTRRDLLPDDLADELAKLQDRVPPFSSEKSREIIEEAYGKPISEVFSEFSSETLAAASISQVHTARLHSGEDVVVKVLRPGIEKTIRHDIDLLYTLAHLATRYWKDAHRLRPVEVVQEYEKTIFYELDLMREAANASQLHRNFKKSDLLYIPEIFWPYARKNILVMERIYGVPVDDIEQLREKNIDLKALSSRGVEIFFTQVFSHNFFHADMHPGNIFVADDGQYIAVDFGIVGSLSFEDQHYLAGNFLAFFNRDYQRVAELHVQSGWISSETRIDEFESAIRSVCEPIFEKPLKEISFGHLLLRLFQTARRFDMQIQPQLVLLQKTLLNIEGLGRQLNPDLNLWETAKPFLEKWMRDQIGPSAAFKELKNNAPRWMEAFPKLPMLTYDTLEQINKGKLQVNWKSDELKKIHQEIKSGNRRTFSAIVGGSLIISATILLALNGFTLAMLGSMPLLSWLLAGIGLIILLNANRSK